MSQLLNTPVRVLYDYDYTTRDGRHVSVRVGDRLTLLQKSNEWWNVIRDGERKPFYVPADYVAILGGKTRKHRYSSSNDYKIERPAPPRPEKSKHVPGFPQHSEQSIPNLDQPRNYRYFPLDISHEFLTKSSVCMQRHESVNQRLVRDKITSRSQENLLAIDKQYQESRGSKENLLLDDLTYPGTVFDDHLRLQNKNDGTHYPHSDHNGAPFHLHHNRRRKSSDKKEEIVTDTIKHIVKSTHGIDHIRPASKADHHSYTDAEDQKIGIVSGNAGGRHLYKGELPAANRNDEQADENTNQVIVVKKEQSKAKDPSKDSGFSSLDRDHSSRASPTYRKEVPAYFEPAADYDDLDIAHRICMNMEKQQQQNKTFNDDFTKSEKTTSSAMVQQAYQHSLWSQHGNKIGADVYENPCYGNLQSLANMEMPDRWKKEGQEPHVKSTPKETENELKSVPKTGEHLQVEAFNKRAHEQVTYANLPLLGPSGPPPTRVIGTPLRRLDAHWEEHQDSIGRVFYYNIISGKSTWKPPRLMNRPPHIEQKSTVIHVEAENQTARSNNSKYFDGPTTSITSKSSSVNNDDCVIPSSLTSSTSVSGERHSSATKTDAPNSEFFVPLSQSVKDPNQATSYQQHGCDFKTEYIKKSVTEEFVVETCILEKTSREENCSVVAEERRDVSAQEDEEEMMVSFASTAGNNALLTGEKEYIRIDKNLDVQYVQENNQTTDADEAGVYGAPPVMRTFRRASENDSHEPVSLYRNLRNERLMKSQSMFTESQPLIPEDEVVPSFFYTTDLTRSGPLWYPCDYSEGIMKQGTMNKTKICEAGKKTKKNWCVVFVVLTRTTLWLYKETKSPNKSPTLMPSFSHPEDVLDLSGCSLEWNKEKSSKKNVCLLMLSNGDQFLLQTDNVLNANEWFHSIREVIAKLPKSVISPEPSSPHSSDRSDSGTALQEESGFFHKLSKYKHSHKSMTDIPRASSTDDLDQLISPAERKVKIKNRLKKFFQRRPPAKVLEEKGIIKDEECFGSTLMHLFERDHSTVPNFLKRCVEEIEIKGLDADGLYRMSGNLAQIQKVRTQADQSLSKVQWHKEDVHVLSGALKLFFRELKEPLIPFNMYDEFMFSIKLSVRLTRITKFREHVSKMPRPHRDTLKFFFTHLQRVIQQSDVNRMHAHNLAIVFGPTLLRQEIESSASSFAVELVHQNNVVEFFLTDFQDIFFPSKETTVM